MVELLTGQTPLLMLQRNMLFPEAGLDTVELGLLIVLMVTVPETTDHDATPTVAAFADKVRVGGRPLVMLQAARLEPATAVVGI